MNSVEPCALHDGPGRLRPLVGAGQTVLLVVKVLAFVAGAGAERLDLVAVEVVADREGADRRRPVGMRRPRRRIGVGKVVVDLRIDRAVLHRGLGLVGDVVDGVVALAERVSTGGSAVGAAGDGAAEAAVR